MYRVSVKKHITIHYFISSVIAVIYSYGYIFEEKNMFSRDNNARPNREPPVVDNNIRWPPQPLQPLQLSPDEGGPSGVS